MTDALSEVTAIFYHLQLPLIRAIRPHQSQPIRRGPRKATQKFPRTPQQPDRIATTPMRR
jgi:hypothetical protein